MRYNDISEQCKRCDNLRTLGVDRFGYHLVICMKSITIFYGKCDCYERVKGEWDEA